MSNPQVELHIANYGVITLELDAVKAPLSTANFLEYVKSGHYDGTIFHRVINNFMVQGGGYDAAYAEKKTRAPVVHEGREALAKGGQKNVVGTLAMARTNDPNSATAQFFINLKNNTSLDYPSPDGWGYAVFGKVVKGTDVVDKIKAVATGNKGGHQNVPTTPITITSATLVK